MALDTNRYKNNPLVGVKGADFVKLSSASVKQQMVTNSLLNDLVSLQSKTLQVQQARLALERKAVARQKYFSQESAIEKQWKPTRSSGGSSSSKKKGGLDLTNLLKNLKLNPKTLLLGGAAVAGGLGLAALLAGGFEGAAQKLEQFADQVENLEKRVRKTLPKIKEFFTPIKGFSTFDFGNAAMGYTYAKRFGTGPNATGGAVRGAIARGTKGAVKATARGAYNVADTTGDLMRRGGRNMVQLSGQRFRGAAQGMEDLATRMGPRAGSTTLPTNVNLRSIGSNLKNRFDLAMFDSRLMARGGDPSKSIAGRIGSLRQGTANVAGNLRTQASLFKEGLFGGAGSNARALRLSGAPFPNVAVGGQMDDLGGAFRVGRNIKDTAASIKSGEALRGITDNIRRMNTKTVTGLNTTFKSLPGQVSNLAKSTKAFAGSARTAVANFDLGKAAIQSTKVAQRGAQGALRAGGAVVRATPTAIRGAGQVVRAGGGIIQGGANLTRGAVNMVRGSGGLLRGAGAFAKRIPVLGSLMSAGFGAFEADQEQIKEIMARNPGMTAAEARQSSEYDKSKTVGRSAGSGLGAGAGTVIGGILGSALGPIGTALGAAAGAWLGENVGKFLGEGFANTFKSFNWGETFAPVITTFQRLGSSITGALDTLAGVFGVGGETADGEGFITVLKNVGRILGVISKLMMKALVPIFQVVGEGFKLAIDGLASTVKVFSQIIGGAVGFMNNLIDSVPGWLGGDSLRNWRDSAGGIFSGDVIGNLSNMVDGMDLSFPVEQPGAQEPEGKGGGGVRSFVRPSQGAPTGVGGGGTRGPEPVVTSRRGWRWGKMHQGIDIGFAGDRGGQRMYLPMGAKITDKRREGYGDAGYGNSIYFTTDDGYTHLYAHMRGNSPLKVGQKYPKGTFVGLLGNSGRSTAPHLHWEVARNEQDVGRGGPSLIDPLSKYSKYAPFSGSGSSIPSESSGAMHNDSLSSSASDSTTAPGSSGIAGYIRNLAGKSQATANRLRSAEQAVTSVGTDSKAAEAITSALAPLAGIQQQLLDAAGGGSASSPGASGTVVMFPTSSPVKDGGHIFNFDF